MEVKHLGRIDVAGDAHRRLAGWLLEGIAKLWKGTEHKYKGRNHDFDFFPLPILFYYLI